MAENKSGRKKKKHSGRKRKKDRDMVVKSAVAIIAIIILALIMAYSNKVFTKDENIVAEVNGQEIAAEEMDELYWMFVSPEYQEMVTKEIFLNQTMIPQILLLQEAEKRGIQVTKAETDSFLSAFMEQSGMTREDLEEQIEEQGMDYNKFFNLYSERLKIVKLLNETVSMPMISEEEIRDFYDENKASFSFENQAVAYEDAKDQIESYLLSGKQQESIEDYISSLREKADIKLYAENIGDALGQAIGSFQDTGGAICYEDGKPVVRMFSTTACPHCSWIKETFDSVAMEYMEQGQIAAYHWEIDTGDNTLTEEAETGIPQEEIEVLREYDPMGGVPLFVFGCRYVRIGNAYEFQDDLNAEEEEFRSAIESLLTV